MSDEHSPSKDAKNEYLDVKGSANTVANLMRPPMPKVSEMAGTFEKLKQLRETIANHSSAKETDNVNYAEEDGEGSEDRTVMITVNNTLHGQVMTLDESGESDSEEVSFINDVDPSKYTTLSDSDDKEDDDIVEISKESFKGGSNDPIIELLSPSDSEESSIVEDDDDYPVHKKRQKLE